MSYPRPILKRNASSAGSSSGRPAVHFPPQSTLVRTYCAHSPAAYDRTPIVVAPNACALPERGCPGRTYTPDASSSANRKHRSETHGYHPHPRVRVVGTERAEGSSDESEQDVDSMRTSFSMMNTISRPPPLVMDMSSDSSDSDALSSPGMLHAASALVPDVAIRTPHAGAVTVPGTSAQRAFLPHPRIAVLPSPTDECSSRRKSSKDSRKPSMSKEERERRVARISRQSSFGTNDFNCIRDEGCLGGF